MVTAAALVRANIPEFQGSIFQQLCGRTHWWQSELWLDPTSSLFGSQAQDLLRKALREWYMAPTNENHSKIVMDRRGAPDHFFENNEALNGILRALVLEHRKRGHKSGAAGLSGAHK